MLRSLASRLVRGDYVEINTGRLQGERGYINKSYPKESLATIKGIKEYRTTATGKTIKALVKFDISKLALIDPVTNRRTRIRYGTLNGTKTRFSTAGNSIPYPSLKRFEYLRRKKKPSIAFT